MTNIYWVHYKKKGQNTLIKKQFLSKARYEEFLKKVKSDKNLIFVGVDHTAN